MKVSEALKQRIESYLRERGGGFEGGGRKKSMITDIALALDVSRSSAGIALLELEAEGRIHITRKSDGRGYTRIWIAEGYKPPVEENDAAAPAAAPQPLRSSKKEAPERHSRALRKGDTATLRGDSLIKPLH